MKKKHSGLSDIEGSWQVSYRVERELLKPNVSLSEVGQMNFRFNVVSGFDPFGGLYSGTYNINGSRFSSVTTIATCHDDAETIFNNLNYPFALEFSGNRLNPDRFHLISRVVEGKNLEILINFKRVNT